MVSNFELIRPLLRFEEKGDFYFIQVIKRRKDNPDLSRSEKLIKDYSVFSLEEYDKVTESIKNTCKENNARAYIRLNRRNTKQVSLRMLQRLVEWQLSDETSGVHRLYAGICGEFHSEKRGNNTWVVDIDDENDLADAKHLIGQLQGETGNTSPILFEVPTVNGKHLITSPFNSKVFSQHHPNGAAIEIHKDNPTILYFE